MSKEPTNLKKLFGVDKALLVTPGMVEGDTARPVQGLGSDLLLQSVCGVFAQKPSPKKLNAVRRDLTRS